MSFNHKSTIAFTLCSNNYLAQAKSLFNSFAKFHPGISFVIGLVDSKHESIHYENFLPAEILVVNEINIEHFEVISERFNLKELNTAVKPYYFRYFFECRKADYVIYLDPDIIVYSRFSEVLSGLEQYNIILTPHMCSPIDDNRMPSDYHTLKTGVFNLGFLALSNYSRVITFLNWWTDRITKYGYGDLKRHMFFDQIWINYVPAFFDNYFILKHYGYNVANWNLHERKVSIHEGIYLINDTIPLVFFHFSGFNAYKPQIISSYQNRYDFDSREDIRELFNCYTEDLKVNGIDSFSKATPAFGNRKTTKKQKTSKNNVLGISKKLLRKIKSKL